MKSLSCRVLMLLAATPCLAELVVTQETIPGDDAFSNRDVTVNRMTVTPAAAPSPAFAFRLIKPLVDLKEGNAPAYYRRIHAENTLFRASQALDELFGEDQWSNWLYASETPINRLPLDKLRRAVRVTSNVVTHGARAGADRKRVDWGIAPEELEGMENLTFLLPEFQSMRQLARMTTLQTRLAIAERRYSDAVDLMRINYRMGRDTAEAPILVCGLIGLAITGVANGDVLDFIAAPDSPNLYWALTELPDPFISLREAVQLEMSLGLRMFPLLRDAETATRAPEEWNRLFRDAQVIMPQLISGSPSVAQQALVGFGGVGAGIIGYPHAKQRLIDWGYDSDEVEAMAVGHVMAIYSKRIYQLYADEIETEYYLPWPEIQSRGPTAWRRLGEAGPLSDNPDRELIPIADSLIPGVRACRNAEARLQRDVALLRAIEAVRMHAAETGALPASLADVTCVPVPKNPSTDLPFEYSLAEGVATFTLPMSDGHHLERRFEIQLAE